MSKKVKSDPPAASAARNGLTESAATASPYTGAPGGVKIGTVSSSNGTPFVVGVYAEATSGGVQFWVQVESGTGDLRGFFLDVGTPGGSVTRAGSSSNNMNGTGYSFDYGVEIGSSGSSDYVTKATFTLADMGGMSLAQLLDGATFGIRAVQPALIGPVLKLV